MYEQFSDIGWVIAVVLSFIFSGTIHEYMHAWMAKKLGDYTATVEGRLTLNPLAHIDPIGALLILIAGFGWMKPVPVNEYNFKHPAMGMAAVALAGPLSNLALAIVGALAFRVFPTEFLIPFIQINLVLALFNLIPIPPLDGYRIVRAFLPSGIRYYWEQLENYGWIILLAFLLPFSPLNQFISLYLGGVVAIGLRILLG